MKEQTEVGLGIEYKSIVSTRWDKYPKIQLNSLFYKEEIMDCKLSSV